MMPVWKLLLLLLSATPAAVQASVAAAHESRLGARPVSCLSKAVDAADCRDVWQALRHTQGEGDSATVMPAAAGASISHVSFEKIEVTYGDEPPLEGGVWYPARDERSTQTSPWPDVTENARVCGNRLPLIVISHGGGASYAAHSDTAIALAEAGFVVAAVNHAGDDQNDQSRVVELWRRPEQLSRLITYMLQEWPQHRSLNSRKVGVFGFSNGGFTVLVAAGGVPDLTRIGPYCHSHSDHDLCTGIRRAGLDASNLPVHLPTKPWVRDRRIRAIVVAAPAFGFAFGKRGLASVRVPVQLWRAENDRHQPNPYYDEAVREALPLPPEYHVVPGAGHFDFLPPCDVGLAKAVPEICSDPGGFDRGAFHSDFNAAVVQFFRSHLSMKPHERVSAFHSFRYLRGVAAGRAEHAPSCARPGICQTAFFR